MFKFVWLIPLVVLDMVMVYSYMFVTLW